MKLLLFKLSSLGDLLHVFPLLTALQKQVPKLEVTWVVDAAFKEVPAWHPAVKRVIAAPLRDLKNKTVLHRIKHILALLREVRAQRYDAVLDAQGLFKSALLAKCARGYKIGFARGSAREPVWWLYQKRAQAPFALHAITRLNRLFNAIPNFAALETEGVDYALPPWRPQQNKVLLFAHGTTWPSKHYPDSLWRNLVIQATQRGYEVWLPHANSRESQRAQFLQVNEQVKILPKMTITALKDRLYDVAGMIAVDTGLAHIAAALGVPCVALYGPTDKNRIGTVGRQQIHLAAEFPCAPCGQRQCTHPERHEAPSPPCFRALAPELILEKLELNLRAADSWD